MYNPIKIIIAMWREADADERKDYIEGFVGMAMLMAICFMLSGVSV